MTATLRDVLQYDNTSLGATDFSIPLPGTLVNLDWGIVLVAWTAPGNADSTTTLTSASWTILQPVTTAGQISFAVLARQFLTGDLTLDFTLADTRQVVVVGAWYSGVDKVDIVGAPNLNVGTVRNTQTAPSITTSAVTGDMVLSLFATSIHTITPTITLSQGTLRVQQVGTADTVLAVIGDLQQTEMSASGDTVATLSQAESNGAGIQVGLIPSGSALGYPVHLTTQAALTASGVVISEAVPLAASVSLAATGIVISGAHLAASVTLTATGVVHGGTVFFGPHAALTAHGLPAGSPHLGLRVDLASTGSKHVADAVALGPHVALSAVGVKKVSGSASLSPHVALSATGSPSVDTATIALGPHVVFTATGAPIIAVPVSLRPRVQFGAIHATPSASGEVNFTPKITLRATARKVVASASAALGAHTVLTAVGTPNLTPVGLAQFGPHVVLTADGFEPETSPVGITIEPVLQEADPVWHAPGPSKIWSVPL